MKSILVVSLLVAIVVLACAQQQVVCPDGSVVDNAANCPKEVSPPKPEVEEVAPAEPAVKEEPVIEEEIEEYDPEVEELLSKYESKLKSVSFLYAPIEMTNSGAVFKTGDRYFWRDTKVRVEAELPEKYDKESVVDTIYLDLTTKEARGFCMSNKGRICSEQGEERLADFKDYDITYPFELLDEVAPSAFLKETKSFESRNVQVLWWEANNQYYEIYIDQFMGLPLHYAYFADAEHTDLQGGVEYHDIAYNLVKEEDVTPPELR